MATDPRWIDENGNEIHEDHRGLVYDIRTLVDRRRALGIFGGIGLTSLLAACAAPRDDAFGQRHGDDHAERDRDAHATAAASGPVSEAALRLLLTNQLPSCS